MTYGLGIAAALGAPLVMTIGFLVWEDHWKGSAFALNLFKCNLATLGFVILSTTTRPRGELFPPELFTRQSVGYLMLSSTIGILIGDWTWLKGLKIIGAKRVILMDSLKPFMGAFFGWMILDEALRPAAFGGIVLTAAGVLVVSLEKTAQEEDSPSGDEDEEQVAEDIEEPESQLETIEMSVSVQDSSEPSLEERDFAIQDSTTDTPADSLPHKRIKRKRTRKEMIIGHGLSLLNVVLDTYGAVLIKQYGQGMTVWEINLVRFGFAGVVMLLFSLLLHLRTCMVQTSSPEKDETEDSDDVSDDKKERIPWYSLPFSKMTKSNWIHVSVGVLLVTFLTPSLSNYALFQIALALALTLSSVGPLYSLPLSFVLQKEVPTLRAFAGAVLAVAGVVILAFKGTPPDE